jgi:hypothetical protein
VSLHLVQQALDLADRLTREEWVDPDRVADLAEAMREEGRSFSDEERTAVLVSLARLEQAIVGHQETLAGALKTTGQFRRAANIYGFLRSHNLSQNVIRFV